MLNVKKMVDRNDDKDKISSFISKHISDDAKELDKLRILVNSITSYLSRFVSYFSTTEQVIIIDGSKILYFTNQINNFKEKYNTISNNIDADLLKNAKITFLTLKLYLKFLTL